MKPKIVFLFSFLFLAQFSNGYCLESNLFPRFGGKTVKVFVMDVKDSTGKHDIDPALVKTRLESALGARKSIQFQVLSAPGEADITIETNIVRFSWSDHDPIDMLVGVGGTAMDAAIVEDYAAVEADVVVHDARSKKPLWQERVFATVTKKPMSMAESVPLVTDNFVKAFIKDCFSKRKH